MNPELAFTLAIATAMVCALTVALILRHFVAGAAPTQARLAALEAELAGLREAKAELFHLREAKAQADSLVAARTEAVERLEAMLDSLNARLAEAAAQLDSARAEAGTLRAREAALTETLEQERRQAGEKQALLIAAREQMTQEFKLLADEVMRHHGESFAKQNREQVEGILAPLRDKLVEFQQGLQSAHTDSAKERATLAEQIRQLSEHSARMSSETRNLTKALKGKAQTQGAWGEMILASILERSGLRAGEEYVTQESHTHEDGSRLRPDVVVNLPGGQRVVIDSKVSLTAFEHYVNAENEPERAAALARHLASLKTHIRTLGSKAYHAIAGSDLDYVVMFVPIEGALAAALQEEPDLTTLATDNNVAIATPTTLMVALRTIANVWQVERRNRNAEDIANRAGKLYDKFVGFLSDMTALGERLDSARKSYDGAMGKLSSGSGNLVRQVEMLKSMGARTAKAIPVELIDEAEPLPAPSA